MTTRSKGVPPKRRPKGRPAPHGGEAPSLLGRAVPAGLASVAGQVRALAHLRALLAGGRLANAYLFHGPWGVGKTRTALAVATTLLCPARTQDACGQCAHCHRAARLSHPDLRFLFPVSGEESELEATIAATLEAVAHDPLHVFTYEKAASIRISLTRDLLRELSFRPFEAERRVVVVRDADRMRADQYSALLKSLEEPGESTVWVLTTSRLRRLPDTVRSRCLAVRFGLLAEEEIERFLVERAGVPAARARLLAVVSAGSLGRALLWRDEDPTAARDEALDMLRPALAGDPGGLLQQAAGIARGWNRERTRRVLEFQMLWVRDVLRLRYGADPETLVNRDRAADLRRAAEKVSLGEIKRRLAILEEIGRAVESNVNPEVAFFSGLARVGRMVEEDPGDWPPPRASAITL
jgi:DNA polymerase-3 subunit delta'